MIESYSEKSKPLNPLKRGVLLSITPGEWTPIKSEDTLPGVTTPPSPCNLVQRTNALNCVFKNLDSCLRRNVNEL